MTHTELLHRTSARELVWWKALYQAENAERQQAAEADKQGIGRGKRR